MTEQWLGVDTGGTFTDFVYIHGDQLRVHKTLSTPDAPEQAILRGVADMGLTDSVSQGLVTIVHGTTVATNAVLQGKGARTVYITNSGLTDVLRIGRQTRRELYSLTPTSSALQMDPALNLGIKTRVDAKGTVIDPLTADKIQALREQVIALEPQAIAINLLFSFLAPEHEQMIEDNLRDIAFVTRSSFVLPEYKEYERGVCTYINARLGPTINHYLTNLSEQLAPSAISIMQSSGVTIAASQASRRGVNLLLSGPAGGLKAAEAMLPGERLMTFDMGGTSTDVAVVDGGVKLTSDSTIAGLPLSIPMADIHTIGAGGGSIAWVDQGGLLNVGPESAGAVPGPACYGQGGVKPTVTDANLILGRLQPSFFQNGEIDLDLAAAISAINSIAEPLGLSAEQAAEGIIQVANEHMARALRLISVARGHDPRDFQLTCFGGAGGLHLCDLAENLMMTSAAVPAHGGVFSALGMLAASPGREFSQTFQRLVTNLTDRELDALKTSMKTSALAELQQEGIESPQSEVTLSLRYVGQSFTLDLPEMPVRQLQSSFHEAHQNEHGHQMDKAVELVNVRLHLEGNKPVIRLAREVDSQQVHQDNRRVHVPGLGETTIVTRETMGDSRFSGPAIVVERNATTLIKPGWVVQTDERANLRLKRVT